MSIRVLPFIYMHFMHTNMTTWHAGFWGYLNFEYAAN